MGRVFISYAREDKEGAYEICKRLSELGFDPWIDGNDLAANDDIAAAIDAQISKVDAVLVLWSDAAKSSVWVRGEALSGLTADKYVGALLQAVVPPVPFNTKNAPDLSDWNLLHDHKGWLSLVRGLVAMSGAGGSGLLRNLETALQKERASLAAEVQAQLPLAGSEPEEREAPAEEEHAYTDVDHLVQEAEQILSSAARLDLNAAIVQAAMDQEMLRDAAFVVSAERKTVSKPRGARFTVVETIQKAIDKAKDGDLIVVTGRNYAENITIKKKIRLVGIGYLDQRPTIRAANDDATMSLLVSARVENINIETRLGARAIHFAAGQSVLLRCDVTRFAPNGSVTEPAVYVAGAANPIVMATSITSKGCSGIDFVTRASGTFIGVSITSSRGAAVTCKGRPRFRGCSLEAVGGHAVEVGKSGHPTFDECSITGRGAAVVKVVDGRPRMSDSRVKAIRQLAFDFQGEYAGRFERNIVDSDAANGDAPREERRDSFFGLWKARASSKDDARVNMARRIISMRSNHPPIFVANKTTDGQELGLPPAG